MKKDVLKGLLLFIILVLLIQGLGCTTANSVYRKVKTEKAVLKKRVLVLPIVDQAGIGEARVAQITATLVDLLKQDGHLLIYNRMRPSPSIQKPRSPQFGIVIDPFLTKSAEQLGMNVLITGVLNPFEATSRKIGWWPVRLLRRELEVSLLVNVFDIINGTLFLTNLETRKIRISGDDLEGEGSTKNIDENKLEKVLPSILGDQASAIITGLREQPWRGKVLSADGNTVIINAGKDIGLRNGSVFEVFGKGESIRSAGGRSLYLLGPKVGEIKTVKVMGSHASAVPLTGGQFRAGQVIKIKN